MAINQSHILVFSSRVGQRYQTGDSKEEFDLHVSISGFCCITLPERCRIICSRYSLIDAEKDMNPKYSSLNKIENTCS